jgi:hypothetical protein
VSAPIYAYRRGPKTARKTRTDPEFQFQKTLCRYLEIALPDEIEWGTTLNGAHLSQTQRSKLKATGFRPGALDMYFIIDGRTYWAENKSEVGRLTADQKRFMSCLEPGTFAVWRTIDDAIASLTMWGVRLRPVTVY